MNTGATTNPYSITIPFLYAVAADDEPLDLPLPRRKNTKRTGELGEAAFLHQAAARGYKILRPWGDSERYDFVIDAGAGFRRIQVKCTESLNARGYQVQSTFCDRRRKGKLTRHDIDFLAAYIIPLDLWYIVPVQAFPASASLRFYPGSKDAVPNSRTSRRSLAASRSKSRSRSAKTYPKRRARLESYREAWHLLTE